MYSSHANTYSAFFYLFDFMSPSPIFIYLLGSFVKENNFTFVATLISFIRLRSTSEARI